MLQLFNVDMYSYGTYNIWQIPRSLLVTTNVDPIEFNETVGTQGQTATQSQYQNHSVRYS